MNDYEPTWGVRNDPKSFAGVAIALRGQAVTPTPYLEFLVVIVICLVLFFFFWGPVLLAQASLDLLVLLSSIPGTRTACMCYHTRFQYLFIFIYLLLGRRQHVHATVLFTLWSQFFPDTFLWTWWRNSGPRLVWRVLYQRISLSQPKYYLSSSSQVRDSEPSTSLGVLFSPLTSASPTLAPLYDEKMNLKSWKK